MRHACVLAVSCSLLFALANVAVAQQIPPPKSSPPANSPPFIAPSPDQISQLETWLSAMEKWRQDDAKWRNRPVHDGWGRIAAREPPPDAPEWLEAYCVSVAAAGIVEIEAHTKACRLLADPRASIESVPPPVHAAEKPPKHSSFLSRVHLDGLWTTTSTGARLYGIVGSHLSIVDVGRVQIFGPPGVLLLSVPDGDGGRRIALGYTWGVSVRLVDLRLAAPTKNLTLFLNVSKVWLSDASEIGGNARGFDIVGFSIAPRKTR